MKVLVKLGGTLLDRKETLATLASELAELARLHEVVVVHGGGRQVTRFLEERGVTTQFVGGLRVSDVVVLDAVVKIIAGTVNKTLVSALIAQGASAVGLSGVDSLTRAVQLSPDLGYVGQPEETDGRLLQLLIGAGYLPVIACVAGDAAGHIYNVNADQMAISCALGWHADKLFFLTDVPGLKLRDGQVAPRIMDSDIADLIGSGVAHGGMQAKLEASAAALAAGLSEIVIAPGDASAVCRRLLAGEELGTRIAAGALRA